MNQCKEYFKKPANESSKKSYGINESKHDDISEDITMNYGR